MEQESPLKQKKIKLRIESVINIYRKGEISQKDFETYIIAVNHLKRKRKKFHLGVTTNEQLLSAWNYFNGLRFIVIEGDENIKYKIA